MRDQNPAVEYAVPSEGGVMWIDNFVTPRGVSNKRAAEAFINFMIGPCHATLNSENVKYPGANALSYQWLPTSIKEDVAIYPPASILKKSEVMRKLSPSGEEMYAAVWSVVRGIG